MNAEDVRSEQQQQHPVGEERSIAHFNPYVRMLEETGKKDDLIEIEVNGPLQSASSKKHHGARGNDKKKKRPVEKVRYKTQTLSFNASDSKSDVKALTKDVRFQFNVLKPREERRQKRPADIGDDIISGISEFASSIDSFINEPKKGKEEEEVEENDGNRDHATKYKTLLELKFHHVDKFYTEGFDVPKSAINAEASGKSSEDLDFVPMSFVRTVRSRLNRMRIMANINERYEFDVNIDTRCNLCKKDSDGNVPESHLYNDFKQCESCAEIDALKLMTALEFYVLACRHQYAGTLQTFDKKLSLHRKRNGVEGGVSDGSELENETENRYALDSRSDTSEESDEEEEEEEGDTVISMPIDTLSSASIKEKKRLQAKARELARKQKSLEEEGVQECAMQ